ncbi:unnamed protein product [Heligmosomoides polygyrus]|uniref:Exonuclease domain-containing protein n=1 Tax=Heligmosomoides polygyrus TaxID=6339 RepID=A0A3P8F5R6_HELPZ|nr:unnamed protein product [Heligmosomoides polygyrus]
MDSSLKISRKLAAARNLRQPGPQLTLTLERLCGVYMSNPEIRDLVQYSVIGSVVNKPKWAHFRPWKSTSQTVLLRVNENNDFSFSFLENFFNKEWFRMDAAVGDREVFWTHIMEVPVSIQEQIRERLLKIDPLEGMGKNPDLKTEMLVTTAEMVDNGYPFPCGNCKSTKDKYAPVTKDSPLFGLDCEMCVTSAGDYLTKFSGITADLLDSVTTTLEDVQEAIRAVLPPDAILCGHSLEFDLRALNMAHPYVTYALSFLLTHSPGKKEHEILELRLSFRYCIDIGLVYNLSGNGRMKTSLKNLMCTFFDEDIQNSHGHCSVEDAWCAMRLLKMKMENGLIFGNCRYGWQYGEHPRSKRDKEDVDDEGKAPKKRPRLTESKAVRPEHCNTVRPLSYYLVDSKKTVMCGFGDVERLKIQRNKIFKLRRPSSFPSLSDYIDEVSCDLLDYGLALLEIDYMQRQDEYTSEEDEEGELCDGRWRMRRAVHELDAHIEKVIRAAARFSLIIVVMSSEKASVCYLKVKQ